MAKKKNKTNYVEDFNKTFSIKNSIITILIVLGIFGGFYLLANYITNRGYKFNRNNVEATISYEEIMAGSTFNMNRDKYVVVFYNRDIDDDITNHISIYGSRDGNNIYYVNLKNGMNKYVLDDVGNKNATKASELKVTNPTLIKIEDKEITEYIEGKDNILEYLK